MRTGPLKATGLESAAASTLKATGLERVAASSFTAVLQGSGITRPMDGEQRSGDAPLPLISRPSASKDDVDSLRSEIDTLKEQMVRQAELNLALAQSAAAPSC